MFDAIKALVVFNIQSHKKTTLHFNRTGIHRLRGENSHGKSAIFKALYALFLGESLDSIGRNELIRENEEFGIIIATSYSGVTFMLHLHLEASRCYYELQYEGQKIRKFLSDDYKTLLKAVNFHYLPEASFSLNRYKTKTALPFTHTGGTLNYKILDSASEVPEARKAIETFDDILKTIKEDKQVVERKIISLNEQLHLMDDSGIQQIEDKLSFLKSHYETYMEMKPLSESLDTAIQISQEIANLDMRDYKDAEIILPELRILEQVRTHAESIVEAEQQKVTLLEESRKEPVDLSDLLAQLRVMEETQVRLSDLHTTEVSLTEIEMGPPLLDIEDRLVDARTLFSMHESLSSLMETKKEIAEITVKPLQDISSLFTELLTMRKIQSLLVTSEMVEGELIKHREVPSLDTQAITYLLEESRNLHTACSVLDTINGSLQDIAREQQTLIGLDERLVALNKAIGVCPTCGERLSATRHRSPATH